MAVARQFSKDYQGYIIKYRGFGINAASALFFPFQRVGVLAHGSVVDLEEFFLCFQIIQHCHHFREIVVLEEKAEF